MNPSSSFFGKCVTVLIGMALSWATMTNPQIERLARQFFGQGQASSSVVLSEEPFIEPSFDPVDNPVTPPSVQVSPPTAEERPARLSPAPSLKNFAIQPPPSIQTSLVSRPAGSQTAVGSQTTPTQSSLSSEDRIHLASQTLRELGATYLRLEKLTNPHGEFYRVRCDLAGETERVKCCYEATRESAVAAIEDVLRAVRDGVVDATTKVASSG